MKILILHNGILWKSWGKKIKELKDWWSPEIDLDITLERSRFKDIPWVNYGYLRPLMGIQEDWYDKNIAKPAKDRGFDCVILTLNEKDWPDKNVEGWHTSPNLGIEEIQILGRENAQYNFNGKKYEGDQWFNIARHELSHALYQMKGKTDNTHLWWTVGNLDQIKKELFTSPIILAINNVINPPVKYKYFNQNEIEGLKPELVQMLDKARGLAGVPFHLNSTLRSPEKNAEVGGVKDSAHTKGLAVDIRVRTSSERFKILQALLGVGFKRIGVGKTFLHADIDLSKPQEVIWTYE